MRRVVLAIVAVVTVAATQISTGTAFAGPTPSATVTLICDRGTYASVSLTLETQPGALDSAIVTIDCGPGSVTGRNRNHQQVSLPAAVSYVSVSSFTGTFTPTIACTGEFALPVSIVCPGNGSPGATLDVKS